MADEKAAAENEPVAASGSKSGLLKLAVIVGGIMAIEAVGFLLFMPSTAGAGGDPVVAQVEKEAQEQETQAADETAELEVGDFRVTNTAAAPDAVLHLEFSVHLLTPQESSTELTALLGRHKFLVRETVSVIARRATYKELEDPGLACLKQQIRERLGKILGNQYVKGVIVSRFNMYQQ